LAPPTEEDGLEIILPAGLLEEKLLFVNYLAARAKDDLFVKLYALFGDELFLFLSIFSSNTIKIPNLSILQKIKNYCSIYIYLQKRGFSEESFVRASEKFRKTPYLLQRIVAKVDRVLDNFDTSDLLDPEEANV